MPTQRPYVLLVLGLIGLVLSSPYSARSAPDTDRPNILIVYTDDQGYGDFSLQNPQSKIPTPNLDQLAREGMRFTDGHSSAGVCTPSRYALLTGRYHWRRGSDIVGEWGNSWFSKERLTLPEMLQEKGYRTAAIGKWHLGWDWSDVRKGKDNFDWSGTLDNGPLDHGFDYYFGPDLPNFPPYTWIENNRILYPATEEYTPVPPPTQYHEADGGTHQAGHDTIKGPMAPGFRLDQILPRITDKAVEWIGKQSDDQPFFLYWALTSPHAPVVPIKEFQHSTAAGAYGDFMLQTDTHVGQVLNALERNGFEDNTLVIFSSDNGPEGFKPGHYTFARMNRYGHDSRGPLRGVKRDAWEGGHRVPFVVRWPGVVEPGSVSDELVTQIDLMATIAAIVDYDLPDDAAEDSFNLLPLWRGDVDASPREKFVFQASFGGTFGIRYNDWAWINGKSGDAIGKKPDPETLGYPANPYDTILNNLDRDLEQTNNLVKKYPEKVEKMRSMLNTIRERGYSAPRLRSDD